MTTTVFDAAAGQICSDTRWSVRLDQIYSGFVLYVDDTGYDKITDLNSHVMIFAGDAELISHWKLWSTVRPLDVNNLPSYELPEGRCISLSIVDKQAKKVVFDCGQKMAQLCLDTNEILAVFSGSGAQSAAHMWNECRCAMASIEHAKSKDPFSGGETKYLDYSQNISNLNEDSYEYEMLKMELISRGMVMNLNEITNDPVPLQNLEQFEEIRQAMMSGELNASAPISSKNTFVWDDERKARFESVVEQINKANTEE